MQLPKQLRQGGFDPHIHVRCGICISKAQVRNSGYWKWLISYMFQKASISMAMQCQCKLDSWLAWCDAKVVVTVWYLERSTYKLYMSASYFILSNLRTAFTSVLTNVCKEAGNQTFDSMHAPMYSPSTAWYASIYLQYFVDVQALQEWKGVMAW